MSELPVLGDRYELGDVIGRGGMAEVRRGRDNRLGRTVAIKMLRIDHATDPTFQARFRREAQSAASLNHRHIVAVYDTGEDVLGGARVPYIVMEYVAGQTLREAMQDGARITPERAIEVTESVLDALEYSHRAGIVHRDIKPGNVMLTEAGEVKVMDFGIARSLTDTGMTLTQTSAVVGTAQYISPEQARGETADARSDLYATGCVLYELLTGRPPFVGDSLVSVAVSHVREIPTPPSAHEPSIPRDLDAVVMKALAKERVDRYQSAREMREDLVRARTGLPVAAVSDTSAATQLIAPLPAATTEPPLPAEPEEPRRLGWGWITVAALAVLLLGGLIGYLSFREPAARQVSVPTLVGSTLEEAEARLSERGLVLGDVGEREEGDEEPGTVLEQDPGPDELVAEGSAVDLVVAVDPEQVAVPSVVGQSLSDARAAIQDRGLVVGNIERSASDRPADEVLETDPPGGESVDPGTTVNVVVSSGEVEVPEVVGRRRAEAQAMLTQLGFEVTVQEEETDEAEPGVVIEQEPGAGSSLPAGQTVVIVVALAPQDDSPSPEPEPEPDTEEPEEPETPDPAEDESEARGGGNADGNGDAGSPEDGTGSDEGSSGSGGSGPGGSGSSGSGSGGSGSSGNAVDASDVAGAPVDRPASQGGAQPATG